MMYLLTQPCKASMESKMYSISQKKKIAFEKKNFRFKLSQCSNHHTKAGNSEFPNQRHYGKMHIILFVKNSGIHSYNLANVSRIMLDAMCISQTHT